MNTTAAPHSRFHRRIRVLHIVQNLNYGGMERLIADIARRADPRRFESHVLVLQYAGRFAEGLPSHARLHLCGPMTKWSLLRPAPLIGAIQRISPDVVHSHSGVWFKASLAARRAGVPVVVHTEHGRRAPDPLDDRLIDRLAARRTDVVVAVSQALAEQLERTVVRRPARLCVIPNGVDAQVYRPGEGPPRLRTELGVDPSVSIIGSVGRLEPIKGYDLMIAGFASLVGSWTDGPPPVLVLVGDGSERARLEALAARSGFRDRVFFLGWRDHIPEILREFTLFSMSSRSEGTSVSLLEAMSSGLCPVVTDVGGNAAVLGAALRHRLVRPGDPEALASGWLDALRAPSARSADGRAARDRVEHNFSLEAMVREYESIYSGEHPVLRRVQRVQPTRAPSPGVVPGPRPSNPVAVADQASAAVNRTCVLHFLAAATPSFSSTQVG